MLRITNQTEILHQVKPLVMRMLDANEDVPGFVSLKEVLLRPFVDSEETAEPIPVLHGWSFIRYRECYDILFFDELLDLITPEEKARHVAPLVDMFKGLMTRHQSLGFTDCCHMAIAVSRFVTLYVEVLRGAEDEGTSGELVRFVEYVMGKVPGKLGSLLLRMDPHIVDYLLTCFSKERFDAEGIRKSNLLIKVSDYNTLGVVLIRQGFKYSFDHVYYKISCRKLKCTVPHGQSIFEYDALVDSVIVRKQRIQMALEILVHLLCPENWIDRGFLCTLWESLPDPLITPDELYHLMKPFFRRTSVLKDACTRYSDLFPWVPSMKQPRSLKHLARVQIRESMVRSHTIGEKAVRSLGLPRTMEDYLWNLEE